MTLITLMIQTREDEGKMSTFNMRCTRKEGNQPRADLKLSVQKYYTRWLKKDSPNCPCDHLIWYKGLHRCD